MSKKVVKEAYKAVRKLEGKLRMNETYSVEEIAIDGEVDIMNTEGDVTVYNIYTEPVHVTANVECNPAADHESSDCGEAYACPRSTEGLISKCLQNRLKAKIKKITKERDEARQQAKDRETARYVLAGECAELKCKVNELRRQRDYFESEKNKLRDNLEKLVQSS